MQILSIKDFCLKIDHEDKITNSSFTVDSGDVVLFTGSNGCGKSTLLKIIMGGAFDYRNLEFSCAHILYKGKYDLINSEKDNEIFRRNICYISQEDEFESESVLDCFVNSIDYSIKNNKEQFVFDFVKQYSIYDCFRIDISSLRFDRKYNHIVKLLGIRESQMTDTDKKTIKYLAMNTKHMSGGQKKLTNIFSNLVRYSFSNLIILDEPLNNLDYDNVRVFSNVLTRIYKSKPNLAILLVTHCRSIPIVNKVISIDSFTKRFVEEQTYFCNSCFGKISENGMYI